MPGIPSSSNRSAFDDDVGESLSSDDDDDIVGLIRSCNDVVVLALEDDDDLVIDTLDDDFRVVAGVANNTDHRDRRCCWGCRCRCCRRCGCWLRWRLTFRDAPEGREEEDEGDCEFREPNAALTNTNELGSSKLGCCISFWIHNSNTSIQHVAIVGNFRILKIIMIVFTTRWL